MNQLKGTLSQFWNQVQGFLFPLIENEVGQLNDKQRLLVSILEMVRIEDRVTVHRQTPVESQ